MQFLLVLLTLTAWAKPTRFEVRDPAFRNVLWAISDAPLEMLLAKSNHVTGFVELDPQNLQAGIKAELETDVRALDITNESTQLRLRDTVLAASQFPGASFRAEKAVFKESALRAGKPVQATVTGTLSLRGVSRSQSIPVKVTYWPASDKTKKRLPGNLLKVSGTFEINLAHFQFPQTDEWAGTLAPVLKVTVDFAGTDQVPISP